MKTVVLIGARGYLGAQVLDALLQTKKNAWTIQAMIRPTSDASKIEAKGCSVVRGDLMDLMSLEKAFEGADVVINTVQGSGQGKPELDKIGAQNVADACKKCGVSRYVFCSVQTADLANSVPQFHDKYLQEEYLRKIGLSFVALRPGAFLNQENDYLGDAITNGKSFVVSLWNKTVPIGMIYTPDLAKFFVNSIDLPDDVDKQLVVSVGWTRPVTYQEVVGLVSKQIGRDMSCYTLPWLVRVSLIYTVGWFSPFVSEMLQMFNFFDTGAYVNETTLQEKLFGPAPTPEEVIAKYVQAVQKQE